MPLKINGQRLWQSIMSMADIGATSGGGCNRQALTEEDGLGRALFAQWCETAGCVVQVDAMGNMFARREGSNPNLPPVATGSHLDTQPHGGRFDGILGVLAGLEVVRTLNDNNITTTHPLEIVNWTNEEGSRFGPPTMGSAVFAQELSLAHAYSTVDAKGVRFSEALQQIGYQGALPCQPREWDSFIELHIEQGPILENAQKTIGVVTAAQGLRWFDCQVVGQSSHAGTTPMTLRKDALTAASELILAIREIANKNAPHAVATVGQIKVHPGSPNVVPGVCEFSIDLRHPEAATIISMTQDIKKLFGDISQEGVISANIRETFASKPVQFDQDCVNIIEQTAQSFNYSYQKMVSGATHDALKAASLVPTAMIFVPSLHGGISHNEAEWSSPEDCAAGTDVLLGTIVKRATAH